MAKQKTQKKKMFDVTHSRNSYEKGAATLYEHNRGYILSC